MEVRVAGVAIRTATAMPGLEVHPVSATSCSGQRRAVPNAGQTMSVRRAPLVPILATRRVHVGGLLVFLLRCARRLTRSRAEVGGFV